MGRYNVKYKEKWAAFSTITDSFVTEFMNKEKYENWRREEYGRMYYKPIKEQDARTIEDAAYDIKLNRSHKMALECLLETGLSKDEGEKILYDVETKHWCPTLTDAGYYRCPDCGKLITKGQKQCTNKECKLNFKWK